MKELKGKLSIAAVHGGSSDHIRIEISDPISGCPVVILEVQPEQFARAVTGLADQDCQMTVYDGLPIGYKREHQKERVSIPGNPTKDQIREAVSQYEVDGWLGRDEDCENHHKFQGHHNNLRVYEVIFIRHIDPETGIPFQPTDN